MIETCVRMKRDIVREDEFDHGRRRLLNLGHSFGHAVEACSHFRILHGQAVAIGMAVMCRASAVFQRMPPEEAERVIQLLERCGLPTETDFRAEELLDALYTDKKLRGDTMHLVVPERIGQCRIQPVPVSELKHWLTAGGVR